MVKVIDISKHNGSIDFAKVKAATISPGSLAAVPLIGVEVISPVVGL